MDFDRRKEQILAVMVEEYIQTGAPMGSKTVVKRGVKASSATVRHEMSELEALGFLEQPHPSAGRRPTNQAFRYYVDHFLSRFRMQPEWKKKLDALFQAEETEAADLIAETARILSELTQQVGVVLVVPLERARLRSVHFQLGGPNRIRVIFQLLGGVQEERTIRNEWGLEAAALTRLTNLVNQVAAGRTLFDLRRELIRQREEAQAQAQASLLLARAVEVSERLAAAEAPEVFIRGQGNLVSAPEFAGGGQTRELIQALEEKGLVIKLIEQAALVSGSRVMIGEEIALQAMQRCSLVLETYGRGEMPAGNLGVIGPTRMDYAGIIPLVHYTSGLISERLRRSG